MIRGHSSRGDVAVEQRPGISSTGPAGSWTAVRSRTRSVRMSTNRMVRPSGKGAGTSDVPAHDEGLDGLGAFVGVGRLDAGPVPHHVEVQQDAVAAEQVPCLAMTFRALRVLFILAIAAIVPARVSMPYSMSRPSRRQYDCMEQTPANILTSRSCTI